MRGDRDKCCEGCANGLPCAKVPASVMPNVDTRGRVSVERVENPPVGRTRAFERNYDVQAFTGRAVSTVPEGQWSRGQLVRRYQPTVQLAPRLPMYDPTDPRTWPAQGEWQPN